jgi:hypothetical protein
MWNGRFLTGVSRSQLDEQQNRRVPFGPNPYGSGVAGAVYGHAGFEGGTDWTTLKGSPQFFIDPQEKYLTLIRIPETAAPIKLTAFRYPLEDLVEQTDEPEIPARYHFDLIDWMMHLSYLKRDTETYDAKAADKCEADFVKNFGPKIAANIRRTQRERRSNQVRMNQDW